MTQDNSNITLSLNTLHNLLQASPNYEIIQTSLVDIESKFNHAKKLLDFCLLEIATFLDNEPDENMDELQNKVEILQKENEKLRKENEQLKSNRSLPPVEPPAPELEVQLEEDTSLTKSVRRRKPSLDKIQPSVFKRNSLRKVKMNISSFFFNKINPFNIIFSQRNWMILLMIVIYLLCLFLQISPVKILR